MRSLLHIWSFLILLFLALGCSKDKNDCLKSTGEIVFEDRMVQTFKAIRVFNNVNVIVTQGSAYSVTVEAGSNLQGKITTEVVNDTLVLKNENKCNWIRSYKYDINVHVTIVDLTGIEHRGYGDITSTNTITLDNILFRSVGNGDIYMSIDVDYCYADIHFVGDLQLTGTADAFGLWHSGSGWIRCESLVAQSVFLDSFSSGDCFVQVSDELIATIHEVGSVHYSGSPSLVNLTVNGSGQFYAE
ncbi:MAG: DUF2807 domain-containing protein [Flavobacteriales bacterium]|nr:DUF2807 domain-containing protein [Flavobacteriales bacterium]